jgi:hypothetical protein
VAEARVDVVSTLRDTRQLENGEDRLARVVHSSELAAMWGAWVFLEARE